MKGQTQTIEKQEQQASGDPTYLVRVYSDLGAYQNWIVFEGETNDPPSLRSFYDEIREDYSDAWRRLAEM